MNLYGDHARQVFMPYCIERVSPGRYVVLNRNYKPLGFRSHDWVEYENHAVSLKITVKQAQKMDYQGLLRRHELDPPGPSCIYFYNDGCVPTHSARHMRAYLDRLAVFAKLKLKFEPELVRSYRPPPVMTDPDHVLRSEASNQEGGPT